MKLLYNRIDVQEFAGHPEKNGLSRELLLLVLALPEARGLQLWNEMLTDLSLNHLPIAVLLARADEAARTLGINNAPTKNLEQPNLDHVKTLLRRAQLRRPPERVLEVAGLVIDPTTYNVSRQGATVRLTYREFRLLYFLASHPNHFFTREQLVSTIWDSGHELNARIVDVYVWRVRMKVEPDPENPVYLKTLRGAGYVFDLAATKHY